MSDSPELFVSRRVYSLVLAPVMLALSVWAMINGGGLIFLIAIAGSLMLGLLAPWRVAVRDEGLVLSFPMRRSVVLPKADATVWIMRGRRAIAFLGERPRAGRYYQLPVSPARTKFVEVLESNGFRVIRELPRPQ
jgi:hypothetical protein